MSVDVSIIILNYKSRGLVRQQLKFFLSQTTSCATEVIVVDNNSRDGIMDMLNAEFPSVRGIASRNNRGYGSGNNIGMREAHGRYVLIVNPDIILTAAVVEGLFTFMEQHPEVGIAGPKIMNADGTLQYTCARFPNMWLPLFRRTSLGNTKVGSRWRAHFFMESWDHAVPQDVDWLFGSCLMVRRKAIEHVGLFDEHFFLYLEDTDWCRRFWEAGEQVWYVPTVSATHLLSRSSDVSLFNALTNKSARSHLFSFARYLLKYRFKKNPHVELRASPVQSP